MPELPDVEAFRRRMARSALHRKIERTSIDDERLLDDVSAQTVQRALKGHALTETRRHGKYLLARIDNGKWLVLHFGMTGELQSARRDDGLPDYTKLRLDFGDGRSLAYVNKRRLGKIGLVDAPRDLADDKELGPDALQIGYEEFRGRMREKRGTIKAALMDQSAIAGVGNVYADEALLQAGIDPRTPADHLDDADWKHLFRTLQRVLEVSIRHCREPSGFPRGYLVPHRKDDTCPRCSGKLQRTKVSGRQTVFCNSCQKKL